MAGSSNNGRESKGFARDPVFRRAQKVSLPATHILLLCCVRTQHLSSRTPTVPPIPPVGTTTGRQVDSHQRAYCRTKTSLHSFHRSVMRRRKVRACHLSLLREYIDRNNTLPVSKLFTNSTPASSLRALYRSVFSGLHHSPDGNMFFERSDRPEKARICDSSLTYTSQPGRRTTHHKEVPPWGPRAMGTGVCCKVGLRSHQTHRLVYTIGDETARHVVKELLNRFTPPRASAAAAPRTHRPSCPP
jgi:hypothetical protein